MTGITTGLLRSLPVPPPGPQRAELGFEGALLKAEPIRPCSRRGFPSLRCCHLNWWALTSPFHPYPGICRDGFPFCGTFLGVAPTPCYGAPCPVELGLSSPSDFQPVGATTRPALTYNNILLLYNNY